MFTWKQLVFKVSQEFPEMQTYSKQSDAWSSHQNALLACWHLNCDMSYKPFGPPPGHTSNGKRKYIKVIAIVYIHPTFFYPGV